MKYISLGITVFILGCSSDSDMQAEANKICHCYDRIHYANSTEHPILIDSCNTLYKVKLSELNENQTEVFDAAIKNCPH